MATDTLMPEFRILVVEDDASTRELLVAILEDDGYRVCAVADGPTALHPRHDVLRRDLERILRQRTALLRQSGGRLTPDVDTTLDVWDAKLVVAGEGLADARADLVARLEPALAKAYADLAPGNAELSARYDAPWRAAGLASGLAAARAEELRRGLCLVGPHRDDLDLRINSMPARTHASQGEQRSMALAPMLRGRSSPTSPSSAVACPVWVGGNVLGLVRLDRPLVDAIAGTDRWRSRRPAAPTTP